MNKVLLLISITFFSISVLSFELDYTKANINSKDYYQVPTRVTIFPKYSANEPKYFDSFPDKGKGFAEPLLNTMINSIRRANITLYVDYFTVAKTLYYLRTPEYEVCSVLSRSFKNYKVLKKQFHNNKKYFGKYSLISLPFAFYPGVGIVGISPKKLPLFAKHLWPNTNIYNAKSLLDDPDLYTAQISGSSNFIKPFIYQNQESNLTLKPDYKKRVYEFVASNAFQLPLMLKGKRMDCAPRSSGKGNVVT